MGRPLLQHQSRLLGILTIKAAQRFGIETFFIEEGGVRTDAHGVRRRRRAARPPRRCDRATIDQLLSGENAGFRRAAGRNAARGRPGSAAVFAAMRHNATPADLHLRLAKEPDLWLECIVNLLLETLAQHDPGLRDRLA
jgi:hypothetical protein